MSVRGEVAEREVKGPIKTWRIPEMDKDFLPPISKRGPEVNNASSEFGPGTSEEEKMGGEKTRRKNSYAYLRKVTTSPHRESARIEGSASGRKNCRFPPDNRTGGKRKYIGF